MNTRATTAARAAKKEAMAAAAAAGADDEVACGDDEQAEVTAITLQDVIDIGAEIMDKSPPSLLKSKRATTTETFESRWVSFFNAEPEVCLDVWNRLKGQSFDGILDGGEPMHLLWACFFLQVYATESVLSGPCQCDEDTLRLYVWRFVEKISYLEAEVVSFFVAVHIFHHCCDYLSHPLDFADRSFGRIDW